MIGLSHRDVLPGRPDAAASGGQNPQITLEQVADAANTLAWNIWSRWPHSWALLKQRCEYYQWRNQLSYESRKRTQRRNNTQPDSS